jgi:hypothetical protein
VRVERSQTRNLRAGACLTSGSFLPVKAKLTSSLSGGGYAHIFGCIRSVQTGLDSSCQFGLALGAYTPRDHDSIQHGRTSDIPLRARTQDAAARARPSMESNRSTNQHKLINDVVLQESQDDLGRRHARRWDDSDGDFFDAGEALPAKTAPRRNADKARAIQKMIPSDPARRSQAPRKHQ